MFLVCGLALELSAASFSGKLKKVDATTRQIVIQTKDGSGDVFYVPEGAGISLDGDDSDLGRIETGFQAVVYTNNLDQVVRLQATDPNKAKKKSAAASRKAKPGKGGDSDSTQVTRRAGRQNPEGGDSDWPQFGGPDRDNVSHETGLLQKWPSAGPPVAWLSEQVGAGYSAVAVVKGVVYTMGNQDSDEAIIALDGSTGHLLWSTPIGRASHQDQGDGPRGTPTVSEGLVYGLGGNGDLACAEAESGEIRWKKNILSDFKAPNITWLISESVLIDGDRLICTPGGEKATIVALNKKTGAVIWKTHCPGGDRAAYASANVVEAGGVRQYVQFTAAGVIGVRADNGKFLWRNNRSANGSANCSSPLVVGDMIFSASGYGQGGALLRLASATAKFVYHTSDMKNHHGDMVIVDGLLYGSSDPGILTCLELKNGKVKWQDRSVGKGSVTYADGRIYLRSENGPLALVEATGSGYHETGRFEQPRRSQKPAWSHPVVAEGKLFIRDQGLLFAFDIKGSK